MRCCGLVRESSLRLRKKFEQACLIVLENRWTAADTWWSVFLHRAETYIGGADGLVEAFAFMLIAFVMAIFAHYAIVELRCERQA